MNPTDDEFNLRFKDVLFYRVTGRNESGGSHKVELYRDGAWTGPVDVEQAAMDYLVKHFN